MNNIYGHSQRPQCKYAGHQFGSDVGIGVFDSRGSRQMDMQACPLGSLLAEMREGQSMKIGIGNDHSALEMKAEIIEFLKEKGHEVTDYGTNSPESCDYPVYGEIVARAVASGEVEQGILICGTGLGISLAANKVKGIRAAVCSEPFTAKMARAHNNCNILAFGARVVGPELAKMMVDTWLRTEFEGGRHQKRVDLIMAIEDKE